MSTLTRPPIDRRPKSLTHPPLTGVLLTLPALAFVVVFVLVPLVFAVYMSLTNWPLIGSYHFIGLGNYAAVASDPVFWKSVGYTVLYTAIVTIPILVLGYVLAVVVPALAARRARQEPERHAGLRSLAR